MSAVAAPPRRSSARARPSSQRRERSAKRRLKVVEHESVLKKIRPMIVLTAVVFVVFMFGALAAYVALIDGQRQLDDLRSDIHSEQQLSEQLRREESRVQSPEEVLRIARDDLGMVPPAGAALVTPDPLVIGPGAADAVDESGSAEEPGGSVSSGDQGRL